MIIVVDSGSTKADWKIISRETVESVNTRGLNPVFLSEAEIQEVTQKAFPEGYPTGDIRKVFFYGAGCWDKGRQKKVVNALSAVFRNAEVIVEHDLLGAARAGCGTAPGIACILGTGSNSCLYDGEQMTDNVTNLGYLVGDEGSGSWIGRMLIRAYFYRELPPDLRQAFDEQFPGGEQEILNNIYDRGTPNVYLASFTRFLAKHKGHIFVQKLRVEAFATFIDRHARKYEGHLNLPVNFIGSVAFHFQDIIRVVLQERAMIPGRFIKKPIENLVHFHEPALSMI